jgi:hypothetical protein
MRLALIFLLCLAVAPAACAQASTNRDPSAARIVTEDLPRFWQAHDEAQAAGTAAEREAAFARYLDAGSAGLREFDRLRIEGPAKLAATVAAHPRYYASLRGRESRIAEFEPAIRESLRAMQRLYPDAVFPDVYFVIGRMSSGGTLSPTGLLVGLEMYGRHEGWPEDELGDWHRSVIVGMDGLPHIVVHELVHYQQRGNPGNSLLAMSLGEGIADFITEKASGRHINGHVHDWAEPRAAALWAEFRERMHGSDYSGWLYGGDLERGRPADLGYWIGYRIARAYYERAVDKQDAIREMLGMDDAQGFLDASQFAQEMDAAAR